MRWYLTVREARELSPECPVPRPGHLGGHGDVFHRQVGVKVRGPVAMGRRGSTSSVEPGTSVSVVLELGKSFWIHALPPFPS